MLLVLHAKFKSKLIYQGSHLWGKISHSFLGKALQVCDCSVFLLVECVCVCIFFSNQAVCIVFPQLLQRAASVVYLRPYK